MPEDGTNIQTNNTVVDRVTNCIIDELISGKIKPGDKLATEPELSVKYNAGRNSVREAIKMLQAFGVVYIKRADGTYINDSYEQKMLDPMLYSLILKDRSRDDIVDLRAMIDIGTLNVIILRKDFSKFLPQFYMTFGELTSELHSAHPDVDKVIELDNRFHTDIAQAANNPMINTMVEYINRLTHPSRLETTRLIIEKGNIDEFCALHRDILNVIEERRVNDITKVVYDHYIYWK